MIRILTIALLALTLSGDHDGFCSWDELTTKNCKNVFTGKWECWCPVLTTPPAPT